MGNRELPTLVGFCQLCADVQGSAQGTAQGSAQGAAQGSTQGTAQGAAQGAAQTTNAQAATQESTAQDDRKTETDMCPLAVRHPFARLVLQLTLVILLILLFLFVISPGFIHLDSIGSPTLKDQDGATTQQNQDPSFEKTIEASLTSKKSLISKKLLPHEASFKMYWYKENHTSSFKYVNAAMSIAAYILGIILLATICYSIYKSLQRDRLIRDNNETFQDFFNELSPKHTEYKEMFVQEIMRIYFNKKGE